MNILWYFPIEPLKSRYTEQLCTRWIPDAIREAIPPGWGYQPVEGDPVSSDISVGSVLDATGRSQYCLSQIRRFLVFISTGLVHNDDVIYLQDFWTPGIEAVFYALDQYHIKVRVFAENWAQSVDEFDFTHQMLPWIRHYELGLDARLSGTFVGSSIHRDQLKKAGFRSPIHVTSLPFGYDDVRANYGHYELPTNQRLKAVMFCSRVDAEKNPRFMMDVAETFLHYHPDYEWWVTTSASEFRSNQEGIVDALKQHQVDNPRFRLFEGLTKDQYYALLGRAKIQFNSSFQDYVSWTLLEAQTMGCDLCYPNFRSFTECVPRIRQYRAFDVESALEVLEECLRHPMAHGRAAAISNLGRRLQAWIMFHPQTEEFNVWKDALDIQKVIG